MTTTYGSLLKKGVRNLEKAGIADARRDAGLLLLAATGKTRSFLFLHSQDVCEEEQTARFSQFIERRCSGEPVQYITGSQEFMGLPFEVDPSVLIPRQDTETLVEAALSEAEALNRPVRILDLCCGSGAIAVSVAHFLPEAKVTAADISEESLATARRNAEKNGVEGQIVFLKSNMFHSFGEQDSATVTEGFDMILCNPPYIPTDVIPTLQKEVAEYEPVGALDGGADGLEFYRILAAEAWKFLTPYGILMMEIGYDQAEAVCALLQENGHYTGITVLRDLADKDRVIRSQKRT